MKILIDMTALYHNFSGIERFTLNICIEMIKMDVENEYVLLFKNEIHSALTEIVKSNQNVKAVIIKGKNKLFFNQIRLPYFLYQYKADAYLFMAFPVPLLFLNKNIYSVIYDMVCWDCPETMKKASEIYFRIGIKTAIKRSKKIFTISQFSFDRIQSRFDLDPKRLRIIYCGISDEFKCFENMHSKVEKVREKYDLPSQYLLCLATIEPRKNLKLLIDAFVELSEEGRIDFDLVLAGKKGWKTETVFSAIPEKISNRITFTGFIDDEDLPYIYRLAHCFVFPSLYEGFGIPPLEAMAVGTLVVSSNAASLPEVLGEAAIYFDNNDKEDLKSKVLAVCNDKESIDMAEYSQRMKKQVLKYSWILEARKMLNQIKSNL